MSQIPVLAIEKQPTGIPGFDFISDGGIPSSGTTLVSGTPGSAKTVFACQFLAQGLAQFDQPGVFVTFEERPERIRQYFLSFGWDICEWEKAGKFMFVDVSPRAGDYSVETGDFNFSGLISRIQYAVKETGAQRVALDSVSSIFSQFSNTSVVRRELFNVAEALRDMEISGVITAERTEDSGQIARYDVEEFVADNVVILRNTLDQENRRRTIEVLKYRGASHRKGEFPFTISSEGLVIIPLSEMELVQESTSVRINSGVDELNTMCGGGFYRDSIILATGATGTGKTLITTEFVSGGAKSDEKTLLFGFEESRDQLQRNATSWGTDFKKLENDGLLKMHCVYPESNSLEDHLLTMKEMIEEFQPDRIVLDSLSALERVASMRAFREFVVALTGYIKTRQSTGLFTLTTSSLMGTASVTESHISSIADSILLLRYVEMFGEMRRGITVLKMRGSQHEKVIREYTIDENGMHISDPFRNVTGILSGSPHYTEPGNDRLNDVL